MRCALAADAEAVSQPPRSAAARRPAVLGAGAVALAVAVSAVVAIASGVGLDYLAPACVLQRCDDPGFSIEALGRLDFSTFFLQQPPMGSFSLLVRAPFARIGSLLGSGDLWAYRFGAFVCVLAAALLAVHVARVMAGRGRSWMLCVLVPAAIVVNPLTYQALDYGHPEEILGAALCVGAVLAAGRRRVLAGGLLLGAALATKQWALLAVVPVLVAAPVGGRLRLGIVATAVVAALTLPMLAGNPRHFVAAQERVSVSDAFEHSVTASNVWWPFSTASTGVATAANGRQERVVQYSLPGEVGRLTHPLVAVVGIALALLYARRRRGADPEEALQLLALVLLLRCLLDPLTYSYHHEPFLVALLAYEGLRRRVPVLSAFAIGAILAMNEIVAPTGDAAFINAFYLAWALLLAGFLALGVFAPERLRRLAGGRIAAPAGPAQPATTSP